MGIGDYLVRSHSSVCRHTPILLTPLVWLGLPFSLDRGCCVMINGCIGLGTDIARHRPRCRLLLPDVQGRQLLMPRPML